MAGDWIKIRGGLFQSPKLIGMSRNLSESREFREWLTPGGGGTANSQILSDDALRCVTCALLVRVWSASREYGKFDGNDLILAHINLSDIDVMAGAPGVGRAMECVGWALSENGVRLPNFKQHNVPMTNADRQKEYRQRSGESALQTVTKPLRAARNKSVTREEKSRVEEIPPYPLSLNTKAFQSKWLEYVKYRTEQKFKKLGPTGTAAKFKQLAGLGEADAISAIDRSMANGWSGIFPDKESKNDSEPVKQTVLSKYDADHGTPNFTTGEFTRDTRLCRDANCQPCAEKREKGLTK